MRAVPPPRMQKLTCDELWRIGFVRSPGRRTDRVIPVPGANPLPTPVTGLQMIDIRRPFNGAGRLASRSTSASISSFETIRGFCMLGCSYGNPVRSMNMSALSLVRSMCNCHLGYGGLSQGERGYPLINFYAY